MDSFPVELVYNLEWGEETYYHVYDDISKFLNNDIPCHRFCPYQSAFRQCHRGTFLKSAFFPPPSQSLNAFAPGQLFCR